MFQSKTNPEKLFGSIFVQKRYDKEHAKDEKSKAMIYCLRHGQTALDDLHRSDGWLDLPLNDEGRKNIVVVLDRDLKDIPITCIYTPGLRRTDETATIVKSGLASDPTIEELPEIKTWNLGSLAGGPKKPNKKVVKNLLANPTKSAPDGESYDEFKDRFDAEIKRLQDESKKDGPFLVILSGSGCRRISEMLFGDRKDLDMDEAGVFVMYCKNTGEWTAKVISGQRDQNSMEQNPEAS